MSSSLSESSEDLIESTIKQLAIPKLQRLEDVANVLKITNDLLTEKLEELFMMGFIEKIPLSVVEELCSAGSCSACGGSCNTPPPKFDIGLRDGKFHYQLTPSGWGSIGRTGPVDIL